MRKKIARRILVTTPWILIAWTIFAYIGDKSPQWTTSHVIRSCTNAYPILAWLFGFVCCGCLKDAFPEEDWLVILAVVAVPMACVGHVLWGF